MRKKIKFLDIILTLIQGFLVVFVINICNNKMIHFNFDFLGAKANIYIYGLSSLSFIILIIFIRGKFSKK